MNEARCVGALEPSQLATRLAHWLVGRGLPFRQAHHAAGTAVGRSIALGLPLNMLPEKERANIRWANSTNQSITELSMIKPNTNGN